MQKRSILNCPIEFDRTDFLHLLSLSVGRSIACQNKMGELVIGDNGWNVDVKNGTMNFGEAVFRSGVLGSESEQSGTWLWSWANTESGLAEIVCAPSRRAKKALPDTPEFQNGKFMLDELHTGHNLAMVSCAVAEKNICYYRCPYSGGAAFVTVEGLPDEVFAALDAQSFVKQYMEIVSCFYCDHRLLAAGFLYQNGTDFTSTPASITAHFPERDVTLLFEPFEGLSRLTDLRL